MTAEAVHLPSDWEDVLDVLFDDQRVWAIQPQRYPVSDEGLREVAWPRALRPHLRGRSTVTLRNHLDREVRFIGEVTFGDASGRVRFVDSEGYRLAMNKWGGLERPFDAGSPESGLLLRDLQELLRTLNEDLGRTAFLAYGTLLGAVRGGSFIGHDTDADIALYSRYEHPTDVARESFAVQRELLRRGWRSRRISDATVQVWNGDGASDSRKIDIFAAYHVGDWLGVNRWVRAQVPREAILPLGQVTLEGISLPAPRDPVALLAATYGPGWRVPDPTFRFELAPGTRRRADGWFGWHRRDHGRWRHEVDAPTGRDPGEPSDLARFVAERRPPEEPVVDLGCGGGEDAVWWAGHGREVLGLDYRPIAVSRARQLAARRQVQADFRLHSLYDLRATLALAGRLACRGEFTLVARNLVEALRAEGRANLWLLGKIALSSGGVMVLEFRTDRSADGGAQRARKPWLYSFDPDVLSGELAARGGMVAHRELVQDTRGQSCRMVVTWSRGWERVP